MAATKRFQRCAGPRDMLYFRTPSLWPQYPYLPVVRRPYGQTDEELGLLYDARGVSGKFGYSSTVFLVNMFEIPSTEAEFLDLPKHVHDTFEELAAAGWTVD